MKQTDEELIAAWQGGDDGALTMLFERFKLPVLNFALRLLGNRAEAEDVTAEVFLVLTRNPRSYQPRAKFSTWLFTVTRNACMSRHRNNKFHFPLWGKKEDGDGNEVFLDPPAGDDLPSEELAKQEEAAAVRRAIAELPDDQKQALILREYHYLSYLEISRVMDCTLENVKVLIFRARRQLKNQLTSLLKEDPDE